MANAAGRLILLLAVMVQFPFFNCSADEVKIEQQKIRLGSILILTGEGSAWGVAAKNGIDMAVADLQAGKLPPGWTIEVDHQDDHGDPKQSIAAFRELTETKGISLIIGPNWSTLGLPLINEADRKKVLMISPSLGLAKFNESSPFLFNTWPHDSLLAQKLAEYVYAKGRRRVALVGAQESWVEEQTAAFESRFVELGGKIELKIEPLPKTIDLRAEALKIKASAADAFVSTTDGVVVGSLAAKALKELGGNLPLYSITLDQGAIDAAEGGFEGLEFLTFLTPSAEFQKRYENRYGIPVDIGADSAYDAVNLIVKAALAQLSLEPEKLAKYLETIKEFDGASGRLVSDGKRGFIKPYKIKRIAAGRPVELEAAAEAK